MKIIDITKFRLPEKSEKLGLTLAETAMWFQTK